MENRVDPEIRRVDCGPRTSRAVIHNGVVYLGGQVAKLNLNGSVAEQTREALASVDQLLAKVGSDKKRVLRATVYLSNVADFEEMNTVWDEWISPGHMPARATVGTPLALPELKVEIVITAAV